MKASQMITKLAQIIERVGDVDLGTLDARSEFVTPIWDVVDVEKMGLIRIGHAHAIETWEDAKAAIAGGKR